MEFFCPWLGKHCYLALNFFSYRHDSDFSKCLPNAVSFGSNSFPKDYYVSLEITNGNFAFHPQTYNSNALRSPLDNQHLEAAHKPKMRWK